MPQKGEKMKKKIALILTAMLTVSLAGCGGGNDKSSESKKDDTGKKAVSNVKSPDNDMVIAVQTDATHLDPHVSSNGNSNLVTNSMYETLLAFDENLEIQPLLAESWEMSEDGLSYTFKLREGVKFHDGEPFNAEAVVANWQRGKEDESLRLARGYRLIPIFRL